MRNSLLIAILLCVQSIVFGQEASFRSFSVDDGIAQSQVYSICQDHQGTLWMGTRGGGISTFDGKIFTTYTERDGLVNNYIYKILQDRFHTLWIATNNGLSSYNGKTFKSYKPKDNDGNFTVYTLSLDSKNQLWLGTSKGLFRLKNGQLIEENKRFNFNPKNVVALFHDTDQNMWIGTGNGMYFNQAGTTKLDFLGEKDRALRNAITTINQDKVGSIWFGTYGDGVYCYAKSGSFRIDLKLELYKESIFDTYFDQHGDLWITTLNKGVAFYSRETKQFTFYNQKEGLSNNHVRCALEDNTGNMWFGTSGGGVCQFNGSQFTHFNTSSGLGGNFVYSVFRDSKNRLWIGTSQNGVTLIENGVFTQYNSTNGFANVKVKNIVEDKFGTIYLGTEGQGIATFNGESFQWLTGTQKQYIRQFDLAADSTIWVATSGAGLLQLDPKQRGKIIQQFTYANGKILQSRLTCVKVDKQGRIWYGSESFGAGWIDPITKRTETITYLDGLPSNTIRTIVEDAKGSIWIGMAGAGLVEVQNKQKPKIIQKIGLSEGLISGNIYLQCFDNDGNLCIGTEKGMDVLYFSKQGKFQRIKHYGKGDGFNGVETCQNSCYKDKDGRIWFGTINGMTAYDPSKVSVNGIPPVLSFEDVQLFYEPLANTAFRSYIKPWASIQRIELPHDQNHLSFLFKGINLRNPDGVEYAWKLKGFDTDWSPWSSEKRIVYSNMNPGSYTFLLKARNEDGISSETPLQIRIEISAPFWKKSGFIIGIILFGLASLFFLFKLQTNRIKRKALQAQEQAELAKNLVELEQKALRLQMNPHFIFNALNSIQGLIGTQNETQARYYLAKFSRLMRQILDNSRSTVITLEEEIATLENYLLIEKFCNGDRFDYALSSDLETESNYLNLPPMLIQPFIENAIKHGFKFSDPSKRGMLSVQFTEEKEGIRCTIRDNGIGRAAARIHAENSKESYHVSTGLNVTQERLDLLSDKTDLYTVTLNDLIDSEGNPLGTEVILLLPFL